MLPARLWEHLEEWVNSELLLRRFLDTASTMSAKKLVFMTITSVCEQVYGGPWKQTSIDIREDPMSYGLRHCSTLPPTGANFSEDCARGALTRAGTVDLNGRLLRAMGEWQAGRSTQARLMCNDAFKTTDHQCSKTSDGRHYIPLIPNQLNQLFSNMAARNSVHLPGCPKAAEDAAAFASLVAIAAPVSLVRVPNHLPSRVAPMASMMRPEKRDQHPPAAGRLQRSSHGT
jgi:hypothetical protein